MDIEKLSRDELLELLKEERNKNKTCERPLKDLRDSEEKYRTFFENSPISLWEEDFSEVKARLDAMDISSTEELYSVLEGNPDRIRELSSLVRVVDVNSMSLQVYHAKSKEELLKGLDVVYSEDNYKYFADELAALYEGRSAFEIQKEFSMPDGEIKYVQLNWAVPPGYLKDYSRVLVSIIDITPLMETKTRLSREVKENKVLLNEVHHRVKNNLNVVASLLRLQRDEIDDVEGAKRALEKSRDRVFSMALVHENIYRSGNFSRVDMGEYIDSMVSQLIELHAASGRVAFAYAIDPVPLDITTAVPCGMIINELVSNALKYAFPANGGGRVSIAFSLSEGEYMLEVGDNGIGIQEKMEKRERETLGLWLVEVLSRQIDGELTVEKGNGTRFTVRFPQRIRES